MNVWSCSPFMNELDVLEIRLAELDSVVDVFVLAEATMTHNGAARDLVFPKHVDRFTPWRDKILYVPVAFPSDLAPWAREQYQRERLADAMGGLKPEDLVIVSDVDEVVSADTVRAALAGDLPIPCSVSFPMHPYRLDWRWDDLDDGFCRCTLIRGYHLRRHSDGRVTGVQQAVLPHADKAALVGEYGWHFTYIGDAAAIVRKAESIADVWTKGLASLESAQEAIDSGSDVFGRTNRRASRVPLDTLPVYVQQNLDRFSHLIGGA